MMEGNTRQALELLRGYPELRHYEEEQPLMIAVWLGNADVLEALIGYRADVNAIEGNALYVAAMRGHRGIVEQLLQHGTKPIWEALYVAEYTGHTDIVAVLKLARLRQDSTEYDQLSFLAAG